MKAAVMVLVVAIGSYAQNPAVPSGLADRLNENVNRALWWYRYWNSPQAPHFQGGIHAIAVRFTDRWVILIASLKVAIAAGANTDGTVGPLVSVDESRLYGGSNTAALEQYERLFLQPRHDPGCVPIQTAPTQRKKSTGRGDRLPASRGCIEAPKRISEYNLSLTVNPQAATKSVTAKDHNDVIAVVRTWAKRYYPGLSGKAEVPMYSSDDPAVYVFMRSSDDQIQGILTIQREFDGAMTAGKFLDHPDSIRHYVDRIRQLHPTEVDWALTG